MSRVPVVIITLCRYEHFVRCVESLKKNKLANETELFIGLDYPKNESHEEGYRKICGYIDKGIDGFLGVHIIRQKANVGVEKNFELTRNAVLERFDRFIYSEDDNEYSPNYLEYMNTCMDKYHDDSSVIAVSGYMYPIELTGIEGNILFLNKYYSAFGSGEWADKENFLVENQNLTLKKFRNWYRDIHKMHRLYKESPNQFCNMVKGMVGYIPELVQNNKIEITDLAFGLYMFFEDKKMIFPVVSKVRNWGYDGSGVNCTAQTHETSDDEYHSYDFSKQIIDTHEGFKDIIDGKNMSMKDIDSRMNDFFHVDKKEIRRTVFAYIVSLCIGLDNTASLIRRITGKSKV